MPIRALNLYYARDPTACAQVLATRLRASKVREAIGVSHGRVLRRIDGSSDAPDVMWDCPFADEAAHERDMDARAASAEFESVRAQMRTLTRRFERVLYALARTTGHLADTLTPGAVLAQIWVQQLAADALSDTATLPGETAVLRRLDDNTRLPQWIVEAPANRARDLAALVSRWTSSHPQIQTTSIAWERIA